MKCKQVRIKKIIAYCMFHVDKCKQVRRKEILKFCRFDGTFMNWFHKNAENEYNLVRVISYTIHEKFDLSHASACILSKLFD